MLCEKCRQELASVHLTLESGCEAHRFWDLCAKEFVNASNDPEMVDLRWQLYGTATEGFVHMRIRIIRVEGDIRNLLELPGTSYSSFHYSTAPPLHLSITPSLPLHSLHNLIGDGLHQRLRFRIRRGCRVRPTRAHPARHSWPPVIVVAQLALLEAKPRVRNAEALFDLEQVLQLGGRHRFRAPSHLLRHQH